MIQILLLSLAALPSGQEGFVDTTEAVGLGLEALGLAPTDPEKQFGGISRLCFADLNGDGWPDVVIDHHLVLLNVVDQICHRLEAADLHIEEYARQVQQLGGAAEAATEPETPTEEEGS